MVLISETRAMASECCSAARLRLTKEAICCAVCSVRGSNSSALRVCSHAKMLPSSSSASRKKVRQKRFRPTRERVPVASGVLAALWPPANREGRDMKKRRARRLA